MSEHELWNELGNLYFLSGSYDQAANAYRRSIQMDAGFGRPYSNLALTYVQQGKYDEAIDLYRRSIELLTENTEKAVSWNRLGTVYRHLKDYSRAVIAFQEADELEPQSAAEFPVAAEAGAEPAETPSSILDETPVVAEAPSIGSEPVSEVEWWDVDEKRVEAATHVDATASAADDPNQSWTQADPSQFQQDLSCVPDSGSLTTWGESDFGDDYEVYSPLDPETEWDLPDEDEDISTWLPIPEEEPWNADDLQVPPFLEPIEPEPPDEQVEWLTSVPCHVVQSTDFAPLPAAETTVLTITEFSDRTDIGSAPQGGAQQTWQQPEVDVDVEERPTPSVPDPQDLPHLVEVEPIHYELQPEPVPGPAVESLSPSEVPELAVESLLPSEAPASGRESEEAREIELGIAKFKRVVQLNPRNAHAWDALGTLYKSAGLYKEATLAYQQAISNDSSKSLYYHHLGLVYACEGRDEDAIGAFQRVIEIDPEYSLAHATLGGYYRKMGLEELAQKHIGKAMKSIFDTENEYNRACLEAICGNADQAIELLGVALKNKQTYVDWILRDPDLDFIRQDPRFKQLISDYTR